jgi:hypothetical protein
VNIPITLLQGTTEQHVPARSTKHVQLASGARPFGKNNAEMFTLVETPGYGHLDNFIGKNAAQDVFPSLQPR